MESKELTDARAALAQAQKVLEQQDAFLEKNIGGSKDIPIMSRPNNLPTGGELDPRNDCKPFTNEQAVKIAQKLIAQVEDENQQLADKKFLDSCEQENLYTLVGRPADFQRYKKLAKNRVLDRINVEFTPSGIMEFARSRAAQARAGRATR